MKITKYYLTNNRCYQRNVKRTPIGIQLHTIGTGQGSAKTTADYWNQSSVSACTTYIVDCDTEGNVLQLLPEDVRSWADTNYGNNNLITFEICESDHMKYISGAKFNILDSEKFQADLRRGYNTAVELCADICKRYGWNPTDKLPSGLYVISSHDEGRILGLSSAHVDPTHIWPYIAKDMNKFREDVKKEMGKEFDETVNIKGIAIGDSNVEAISKVVYGEAGIIKTKDSLVAVAQCISDMLESGKFGKTITEVMQKNFSAYGNKDTTDDARQAVYDVFVNGKRRFENAKILQFRSFAKYSDGKGNMNPVKCASLLQKYEYIGKDARDNKWGHLYFGHKIAADVQEEKVQTYRVRLNWGSDMTTQIGAYTNLQNAIDCANDAIPGYKVFDESGNIVYDTGELTVENQRKIAVKWAKETAADNSHGYNNAKDGRGGNPDYACSSFVNEAFRQAGVDLPESATVYTASMQNTYTKKGFEVITNEVNVKNGKGLLPGDVVLKPGAHVEIIVDGGIAGARGNAQALKPENGKAGDQSGNEITVSAYYNFPWTVVLRYVGIKEKEETTSGGKTYTVQAGSFSSETNAKKRMNAVKALKIDAIIKNMDGTYKVQCGVFSDKTNAESVVKKLKKANIEAIIK